jgi:hypothetical protein
VARPNYVTKYDLPTELPMEMAAAKAAAKASSGRGRGRGRGLGRGAGGAAAAAAFLNPGLYGPNGEGLSGRSAHAYAALAGYVANPHVGGSHVPQIGINANNADMETARARFKPGAIKHQLFHLLEEAGPSGLKVQQIIDLMQERGLKDWSTISVPRNTVCACILPVTIASVFRPHEPTLCSLTHRVPAGAPTLGCPSTYSIECAGRGLNRSPRRARETRRSCAWRPPPLRCVPSIQTLWRRSQSAAARCLTLCRRP